ncbi:MAG: hypothetical protein LC107_14160, partial [Chitinophagales bacterium]|nr:hypothetical protein [Chitinophagales bacterium]
IFVLPSYMEYYYKESHIEYQGVPEFSPTCNRDDAPLKIIYPTDDIKIFLPKSGHNEGNPMIMKAYHRDPKALLYWFVNEQYLGTTSNGQHEIIFHGQKGNYQIQINDQYGNSDMLRFEII